MARSRRRQPIDVLWEIYGLSEAAGQARYRITLVVEQLAENGAIADLNFVRTNAGGLPALASDFAGDLVTEMLYERRYSLFFEYGHRWVDARRYGRLGDLRKQLPTHRVFPLVPIPVDECNQRLAAPPRGCVNVLGQGV